MICIGVAGALVLLYVCSIVRFGIAPLVDIEVFCRVELLVALPELEPGDEPFEEHPLQRSDVLIVLARPQRERQPAEEVGVGIGLGGARRKEPGGRGELSGEEERGRRLWRLEAPCGRQCAAQPA